MRGRRTVVIDCSAVTSVPEFWQLYLDIATPENAAIFGRNLDAFWDAIEFEGPGWPGHVELTFANSSELAAIHLANGKSLLDELKKIADQATLVPIILQ